MKLVSKDNATENLDVDNKESYHISNAIKCLEKIPTTEDNEKAILECLKAINFLREVDSVDIEVVRLILNNLLIFWQKSES